MSNDNVFEFNNPGVSTAVRDALTDVLREGARELLAQAVEAEVAEFLGQYRSEQDKTGRSRMGSARSQWQSPARDRAAAVRAA